MSTKTQDNQQGGGASPTEPGPFYAFEVEGQEHRIEDPEITGGEIMDLAGIARADGLVQILDDGTQRTVGENEVIELKPGRRFKKRPRFRRG